MSEAEKNAYTPKSILITGGAGFIGSRFVNHMVRKYPEYRIITIDRLDYCSSLNHLEPSANAPNFKFVRGDITSVDLVDFLIKEEQIDTIYHFAAQSHVDNSFGNSLTFTKSNVFGTHVLLEAARVNNIARFIFVSSDEVYGETHPSEADSLEHSALEPTNPYSATKAAAEYLVKAYQRSFSLPAIITRGNNVYGPHQYPEKIIPKFICLLHKGRKCPIHGNGANTRHYLFVDDAVRAYDVILHKGSIGQIYNIGSKLELSNLEVLKELLKVFGFQDEENKYVEYVSDRPYNDLRYAIDSSKVVELGWEPQVSWEQGIRETVSWYRDNMSIFGDILDHVLTGHPSPVNIS